MTFLARLTTSPFISDGSFLFFSTLFFVCYFGHSRGWKCVLRAKISRALERAAKYFNAHDISGREKNVNSPTFELRLSRFDGRVSCFTFFGPLFICLGASRSSLPHALMKYMNSLLQSWFSLESFPVFFIFSLRYPARVSARNKIFSPPCLFRSPFSLSLFFIFFIMSPWRPTSAREDIRKINEFSTLPLHFFFTRHFCNFAICAPPYARILRPRSSSFPRARVSPACMFSDINFLSRFFRKKRRSPQARSRFVSSLAILSLFLCLHIF